MEKQEGSTVVYSDHCINSFVSLLDLAYTCIATFSLSPYTNLASQTLLFNLPCEGMGNSSGALGVVDLLTDHDTCIPRPVNCMKVHTLVDSSFITNPKPRLSGSFANLRIHK